MGIKKNIAIAAEIMGTKASRLQATATMQQTERLLAQEVRPVTVKAKRGVQAQRGRVRVERVREERTATITLCKGHYWVDLDIEI